MLGLVDQNLKKNFVYQSVVQNSATNNGNVVMMVQPGGSASNGAATGTVSPSIQRIPLPGNDIELMK